MRRLESGVTRGSKITVFVDSEPLEAHEGETLAAAMLAGGRRTLRQSRTGSPRSVFCNMGTCFECLVSVNGKIGVRACMTIIEDGMRVATDGSAK